MRKLPVMNGDSEIGESRCDVLVETPHGNLIVCKGEEDRSGYLIFLPGSEELQKKVDAFFENFDEDLDEEDPGYVSLSDEATIIAEKLERLFS